MSKSNKPNRYSNENLRHCFDERQQLPSGFNSDLDKSPVSNAKKNLIKDDQFVNHNNSTSAFFSPNVNPMSIDNNDEDMTLRVHVVKEHSPNKEVVEKQKDFVTFKDNNFDSEAPLPDVPNFVKSSNNFPKAEAGNKRNVNINNQSSIEVTEMQCSFIFGDNGAKGNVSKRQGSEMQKLT